MVSTTGESLGAIQIDTKEVGRQFSEDDLEVLICASAMVSRAIVLAQLHQERRDLEAAVRIQKSFLPEVKPDVKQLTFFDYYSSARNVGGDYYDYIPLPGQRLAIALGDVSGKGVSAALLMARLSAAVRFALASEPNIPEAVRNLSRVLTRQDAADRFITFLVVVVDLNDYSAVLVNAGHMPPLLLRGEGEPAITDLGDEIVGLPLAVFDRPYEQITFQLQPGDRILLYTDGVTEARNPQGEFFGSKRLHDSILHTTTVEEMGEKLLQDVRAFEGERSQSDDLTIVCFGRNDT
jgi:serine phosphatase RsbU (regulator of sigma subunit)